MQKSEQCLAHAMADAWAGRPCYGNNHLRRGSSPRNTSSIVVVNVSMLLAETLGSSSEPRTWIWSSSSLAPLRNSPTNGTLASVKIGPFLTRVSTTAPFPTQLKLRQVCCDPRLVSVEAAKGVNGSAKLAVLLELVTQQLADGRRILVWMQSSVFEAFVGVLIVLAIAGTIVSAVALWRSTRRPRPPVAGRPDAA